MLPGKKYDATTLIAILRKRLWILVLPPVVTLFVSLIYSSRQPNLYQSDMLIAIVPQRVPDSYVRSTVTLRTDERLEAISTQVMSRTVLEQLIAEFDLYKEDRQRLPMEDIVQRMRANLVREMEAPHRGPRGPEPANAFHVKFTYTDPPMTAKVTQRIGSLFVDQNARDRGALAEATDQFLSSQLRDARAQLEQQEKRLEEFRNRHGNELPTQVSTNMQASQATQMQVQALIESMARDRDRKMMLERLLEDSRNEVVVTTPAPETQRSTPDGNAVGLTATQQLSNARAFLAGLEIRLMPDHPDVVRTKKVIIDLEPKAAAEAVQKDGGSSTSTPVGGVSQVEAQRRERLRSQAAEIESLDRQIQFKETEEKRLRGIAQEYQRRIEAVPGVESEWVSITRDYDTLQEAYRRLLTKSEESKVAVDLEHRQIGEQFRILDPPSVPSRPISPNRLQINGIGLAIGVFLGMAVALLLELRDASFRTEADVLGVLGMPVLALIVRVETTMEQTRKFRRRLIVSAGGGVMFIAAAYVFWTMRLWTSLI